MREELAFQEVFEEYRRSVNNNNYTMHILSKMIMAAGDAGRADLLVDAYTRAISLFDIRTGLPLVDTVTLTTAIRSAGNCNRIDLALDAYSRSVVQVDLMTGTPVFNIMALKNMISAAGICNRIDLAVAAYNFAMAVVDPVITFPLLRAFVLNSMIITAGQCNQMRLAEDFYRESLTRGVSDRATHSIIQSLRQRNNANHLFTTPVNTQLSGLTFDFSDEKVRSALSSMGV